MSCERADSGTEFSRLKGILEETLEMVGSHFSVATC